MAKGQKRSNRELKKPKATKKSAAGPATAQAQLAARPAPAKPSSK